MRTSIAKLTAVLTLAVLISGCVSNQTPRQRDKEYPVDWPDIAELDIGSVALSGTYANEGTFTDKDGTTRAITLASLLLHQQGDAIPPGFASAKVISLRVVTNKTKSLGREISEAMLQIMADNDQEIQTVLGPFRCHKRGLVHVTSEGWSDQISFYFKDHGVELNKAVDGSLLVRVTDAGAGMIIVVPFYSSTYNWARFTRLGDDVPRDPAVLQQIQREQLGKYAFVVQAKSYPKAAPVADLPPAARTARVIEVADLRADTGRIGVRHSLGVLMSQVYFSRDVAAYMRETLEREVIALGYRLVETDADLELKCEVNKFWLHTTSTPLYWDVIAEMNITVANPTRTPTQRREFSATATKRTYLWPSASLCGAVIEECTDQLMSQLRGDNSWR